MGEFSGLFSPEYPWERNGGIFSPEYLFRGERGIFLYFDLLFYEVKIFPLGNHLVLRKRDLANLILSHQSIFWEEKGGIFSPEYSSEEKGGFFWDSLTRVSHRRRTGEKKLKVIKYITYFNLPFPT